MSETADRPAVTGAPYPGAPVTYVEACAAGVPLRVSWWGLGDVVIALLLSFIAPVLVLGVAFASGARSASPAVLFLSLMTPWVGFALWPWFSVRFKGNGVRLDLGYTVRWIDLAWGLAGGVLCLVLGTLVGLITQHFVGDFGSAAGAALAATEGPHWIVYVFAVCAAVGAPMAEELCFRGLVFAALARASVRRGLAGVPVATIGSAVLFALIHLEPVRIPVLLTIGLVLSALRARTGRVGASVVAHALNNLIAVTGLLVVTR